MTPDRRDQTHHPDPWITYGSARPTARLRLFCFPYAGAGASLFRSWARDLPAAVEVCPVQLPGRERRFHERPFTRLEPLADAATQALLPHLDRPFALFGHSMGALIAFEVARGLRRHGLAPAHLVVSGRRAPQLATTGEMLHTLSEPELAARLGRMKAIPEALLEDPEARSLWLPLLAADFAVCETYGYVDEPPLDCPLTVFGGDADDEVSHEDLRAWRVHTRSSCRVQTFPGDHLFIHPSWPLVREALSAVLYGVTRAQGEVVA